MEIREYNRLREKNKTKDFEGKNKGLDYWLFRLSFVGNFGSIFFAYFLIYPSLLEVINLRVIDGIWGIIFSLLFTTIFLISFEKIKRYIIKNFSNDFIRNNNKITIPLISWFLISISIIITSFYLSINGSKNLATTTTITTINSDFKLKNDIDSLKNHYNIEKKIFINDNAKLRDINNELRGKLIDTPIEFRTVRNDYQKIINDNVDIIESNNSEIHRLENEYETQVNDLNNKYRHEIIKSKENDAKNILLFIVIVIINELLIIGGLYFREYYEYTAYKINQKKFEKIYLIRDRYKSLIKFIYNNGKSDVGDKVIPTLELKNIINERTTIPNSNRFVEDFFRDMDIMGVFSINGKRRFINKNYDDALNIIDSYDDTYRVLENIR